MAQLSLALLGPLHITLGGQPVSGFESAKVRALLVYLAVEAARPHHRSALAGLLWPEQPEDVARTNLRQALANLRRAIGDHQARPPFLLISRDTVQLNAAGDHWLDVAAFAESYAACASHAHRHLERCGPCMQRAAQAVALYQGNFLAQFSLGDSAAFEEWALLWRERLHRLALEMLARLAGYHERRGDHELARTYAARRLELDPWCEETHRRLMRVLYRSGQRAEALAQYERCRRLLADELGVEPDRATTTLYEQIRDRATNGQDHGAARQPSGGDRVGAPQHTIPAQLTSFVGREEELAALADMLANPTCRLITIVGPGGMGKTRLALQVAAEQAAMFHHGVAFVALAAVSQAEFLLPAIVAALNLSLQGQHDLKEQLLAYLGEQELLLLLDNFEQVLAGAELLAEILARAPRVTLLVTSRERLALHGEWLFDLEGLSYPPDEAAERIAAYSAVELFTQRARQVQRRFVLAAAAAPVARICRLVEGLPLAIELAAATVRERSCEEIAAALHTNLQLLASPLRGIPERHRSVWAACEHSWRLLSAEQRRVFRRLSVLRGGFEEDAAAQVAGASPALLATLVDKSLLRRSAAGRYDMHELLRQYAAGKLHNGAERHGIHAAHLDYFVRLAENAEPHLTGAQQATWLDRLEVENDNVRVALGWAIDQSDAEQAARLGAALWRFWLARGNLSEGRGWLERVLTAGGMLSPATRAKALKGACVLAWSQGDYAQAVEQCRLSLALYRRIGDDRGIAACLHYLGCLALHQGDYAQAHALLEDSLALRRQLGDRWGIALSLANLGALAGRQGDSAQAETFYEESLALLRELGDKERIAVLLDNLGAVARDRGDNARARRLYEEGLALLRELSNKWNIPTCLNNLGGIALDQGDIARAAAIYNESLLLLREIGDKEGLAACLEGLARVSSGQGRAERAARLYGAAEALRQAIGSRLAPAVLAEYERAVAATRAQLGQQAFATAWAAGRAMAPEHAIGFAVEAAASEQPST